MGSNSYKYGYGRILGLFWCVVVTIGWIPPSLVGVPRSTRRQQSRSRLLVQIDTTTPSLGVTIARKVQPSVVLVTPKGVRNMTARGSGFFIDYNDGTSTPKTANAADSIMIVTSAHVTLPGYSLQVTWNNQTFPATLFRRNATLDLSLLKVNWNESITTTTSTTTTTTTTTTPSPLSLCSSLPEVGTTVFAHGYPASRLRGPAMTSGIVCGIADGLGLPDDDFRTTATTATTTSSEDDETIDSTTFIVTNAAMSGGMSGGPLVDGQGRVVGINALIRPDLRALGNYAVSSVELVEFLDRIRSQPNPASKSSSSSSSTSLWLYNDRMNKKERVASILETVAGLNATQAEQIMMEAHRTGRGMIGNYTTVEEAERMERALRDQDLLVECGSDFD